MNKKPIVFISSTYYDLIDVRAELRQYLEERGFLVKCSDDFDSDFHVKTQVDSIESCLQNVEQSDVVICIIDRRYGPCLGDQFDNLSATHCEIKHARKINKSRTESNKIKLLFFIRKRTEEEYGQLKRKNSRYKPLYIEQGKYRDGVTKEEQIVSFIREIKDLRNAKAKKHSNWTDTFESSVKLKPLVYRRLLDLFPQNNVVLAMSPERFLHVDCGVKSQGNDCFTVSWWSTTMAVNVACGLRIDDKDSERLRQNTISKESPISNTYQCSQLLGKKYNAIWCEYSNTFGDRYRIEHELKMSSPFSDSSGRPANGKGTRSAKSIAERVFVLDH